MTTTLRTELDKESYDWVMRQCAERDLSPGQVIREALRVSVAAERARQDLDPEAFRRYNLPAMEKRITALEEQVGHPTRDPG